MGEGIAIPLGRVFASLEPLEPCNLRHAPVRLCLIHVDAFASLHGLQRLAGYLDGDERLRADRYRSDERRLEYIVSRAVLRLLIGWHLKRHPREVRFVVGPYGKPAAAGADLHLSLAHSGGWVLIGVSWDRELGVDIECDDSSLRLPAIADSLFSPPERHLWDSLPEGQQSDALLRAWTRKEALVKALGCGLTYPLSQLELGPALLGQQALQDFWFSDPVSGRERCWSVGDLPKLEDLGLVSAIAMEGAAWRTPSLCQLDCLSGRCAVQPAATPVATPFASRSESTMPSMSRPDSAESGS